jgi:Spy/CpxP family protein refolding chaperone
MSPIPGWTALRSRWAAVRPRRKAVLALLLVFAAGLAGGAVLEEIADEIDRPLFAAGDHDDDDEDDLTEERLLARLDLTAEQRARVEQVFEVREDRLEDYWDSRLPELESVIDSSRDEIRAILTPAQRAVYDSQLTRLRLHPRRALEEDDYD